ncbi:hypothetical protein PO883_34475 [Massilia sp. DJPM01]|nr:hypothetical protein [Massilia sp. DJPM01]MDM5182274.1 hypothetical protein [Massilia sp. DJPM01]
MMVVAIIGVLASWRAGSGSPSGVPV